MLNAKIATAVARTYYRWYRCYIYVRVLRKIRIFTTFPHKLWAQYLSTHAWADFGWPIMSYSLTYELPGWLSDKLREPQFNLFQRLLSHSPTIIDSSLKQTFILTSTGLSLCKQTQNPHQNKDHTANPPCPKKNADISSPPSNFPSAIIPRSSILRPHQARQRTTLSAMSHHSWQQFY